MSQIDVAADASVSLKSETCRAFGTHVYHSLHYYCAEAASVPSTCFVVLRSISRNARSADGQGRVKFRNVRLDGYVRLVRTSISD